MSWGKETCGVVSNGGKGNNKQFAIFELENVVIDDNTTSNVHLVPTIVTDGTVIYCAFVVDRDDAKLIDWQRIMIDESIIKVAIDSTRYDDNRHFRYSVDFHKV